LNALQTISSRADGRGLAFLLAGGHAVIAYGHPHATFNLELIIRRSDCEKWRALVRGLGYALYREGPMFVQLNPPSASDVPLDLMLVGEEAFTKLIAQAAAGSASLGTAKIVSLRHLLALKCHAIKHGRQSRILGHMDDVVELVEVNRLDIELPDLPQRFLENSVSEWRESFSAIAARLGTAALELPNWSGMDDSSNRVSRETALELCEQYSLWFATAHPKRNRQRAEKCVVEFTL
jgi:hypothetical protein